MAAVYGEDNLSPAAATIHYTAYAPDRDRTDVNYLWWLLRSRTFRDLLLKYVPGGIKSELRAKRLLSVPVPFPPLPEQRRIVQRIEELAGRIHDAYMHHSRAQTATASLTEACIGDVMSRLPNVGQFAEVISFNPRSGPSFSTSPDWAGTPVLMPSAVSGFGVNINKVEYGMGDENVSVKDLLLPGDILIARGNKAEQVGNAGVVPRQARGWVCANLLMRLRVDSSVVDLHFCVYWLRSPMMRDHVKKSMKGTNPNIQKINQRMILDFPFPLGMSLQEQQNIVAYLQDLQAKVDLLKKAQTEAGVELDAVMPSVLDNAFKGKL